MGDGPWWHCPGSAWAAKMSRWRRKTRRLAVFCIPVGGRSDPQLSLQGSTTGFRVPFPTKNHSNRNSWHFYGVKRCLGFESTERIPFMTYCSPGHCLTERQQSRRCLGRSPLTAQSGGVGREPRKADSAAWSLSCSSTLPSEMSLILSHVRELIGKNVFPDK